MTHVVDFIDDASTDRYAASWFDTIPIYARGLLVFTASFSADDAQEMKDALLNAENRAAQRGTFVERGRFIKRYRRRRALEQWDSSQQKGAGDR